MKKRKPKEYEVTYTHCGGSGSAYYSKCHRCNGTGVVRGGKTDYFNRVVTIGKPGSKIALKVSGGIKDSLLQYVLLK